MDTIDNLTKNTKVLEFFDNFFNDTILLENVFEIEQSAKVTKNKILPDRFLIQLNKTKDVTFDKIFNIVTKYNFPKDKIDLAIEYYNREDCDVVIFGIEADNNVIRYKLYFEYENGIKVFGIKWNELKSSITTYTQTFSVNFKDLVSKSNFNIVPKFVVENKFNISGIYVIEDVQTNKNGFNITFNTGTLYLKDLTEDVLSLTNQDINILYNLKEYPLRHFTGGVENNLDKYFNLYFVVYDKNYRQSKSINI